MRRAMRRRDTAMAADLYRSICDLPEDEQEDLWRLLLSPTSPLYPIVRDLLAEIATNAARREVSPAIREIVADAKNALTFERQLRVRTNEMLARMAGSLHEQLEHRNNALGRARSSQRAARQSAIKQLLDNGCPRDPGPILKRLEPSLKASRKTIENDLSRIAPVRPKPRKPR